MARYIEVNEAIKTARENSALGNNLGNIIDFQQIIDDTPTADVVEAVRCKDCMHYKDSCGYSCFHPNQEQGWNSEGGECLNMNPDDFCSYGNKKDRWMNKI